MFSTAVIFDRRGKSDKNKEGALEIRITINRKSYFVGTGMKVLPKHWAGAVVVRPDADALNARLGIIVRRVNEKVNEFIEARKPIDVAIIKEYIYMGTKGDGDSGRFLEWIKEQIPTLQVSDGTRRHYELLYDRLVQYGKIRTWQDLTPQAIYEWDAWLHAIIKPQVKKGSKEKPVSVGTIYNYHKYMRFMCNRAKVFGIITESPYASLVGKFKKDPYENIEYLSEEDMRKILDCHPLPGTGLQYARDLFVFQMFTGLAYSDAQAFDIKDYRRDGGNMVHTGKRIKTGVPFVSVLLPPAIDVLERNGWKVPQIDNTKYNYTLKTLGAALGIENMHSHLARHTFATYMLSKGVKVQNLMRMLGHKEIKQTMKYAKVLAKDVREEYERIGEELKKGTT
jgi:site-specific recombinase XerD